ncbi:MAG: nicotinate-nicotinamide nucleotide adenylyltransferase [Acidimicrobiia bacterium]|nr:nicotinate-nicotinamide nucleotide adenylyltransferase [Acidimicrobiia bacterium]
MERVGVFGGTFDPPHNGHLVVAAGVRQALALDRVLVVVAGEPWQKVATGPVTPALDRLEMVSALLDGVEGVEPSDIEVRRPGPSFTADTLASLRAPDRVLFLVLGFDAAAALPTWERVDEVRELAVPVLVDRPGIEAPPLPGGWAWERVDVPRLDISSTDLRRRLRSGLPVEGLMPPGVISCVGDRGLYSEAT